MGNYYPSTSTIFRRAFVWTQPTGAQPIHDLGFHDSAARGVSADGLTVVGWTETPGYDSEVFFHVLGSPTVPVDLGFPSSPTGPLLISADGSTAVGLADQSGTSPRLAWRWTPSVGATLSNSAANFPARPQAVSADGGVVVGDSWASNYLDAFRWDVNGLTRLESLHPGGRAAATAVTPDGFVLVGSSEAGSGESRGFLVRANETLGETVCAPGILNSTGAWSRLLLRGSNRPALGALELHADRLPHGATTMFLGSRTATSPLPIASSQGSLCLGATVVRFIGPGQLKVADQNGEAQLDLDLTTLPAPLTSGTWGERLYFQAWHRDNNPGPTSNLTSAAAVQVF